MGWCTSCAPSWPRELFSPGIESPHPPLLACLRPLCFALPSCLGSQVKTKLRGHSKRITGLAFSNTLGVLVSSGADAQLCVWSTDGWDKRRARFLNIPPSHASRSGAGGSGAGGLNNTATDTRVQFHNDQLRFLVTHESQLAVYDASKLDRLRQVRQRHCRDTSMTPEEWLYGGCTCEKGEGCLCVEVDMSICLQSPGCLYFFAFLVSTFW